MESNRLALRANLVALPIVREAIASVARAGRNARLWDGGMGDTRDLVIAGDRTAIRSIRDYIEASLVAERDAQSQQPPAPEFSFDGRPYFSAETFEGWGGQAWEFWRLSLRPGITLLAQGYHFNYVVVVRHRNDRHFETWASNLRAGGESAHRIIHGPSLAESTIGNISARIQRPAGDMWPIPGMPWEGPSAPPPPEPRPVIEFID